MRLTKSLKQAITTHAAACYPKECCGVIVDGKYIQCANTATTDEQFALCPKDYAYAESLGEISAIVHSHPDGGVLPSDLDRLQIELHGVPWVICAFSPEEVTEFGVYQPCGYRAPLIGRSYIHGVQDCYSLVRDFYARECGIQLPDFARTDAWWEDAQHAPLYEDNFSKAGFTAIDTAADITESLRYGDVLLCRLGRTHHINHALIWLGDNGQLTSEHSAPTVGNALILHHPYGRLSVREIFGEAWQKRAVCVLRHRQLMQPVA